MLRFECQHNRNVVFAVTNIEDTLQSWIWNKGASAYCLGADQCSGRRIPLPEIGIILPPFSCMHQVFIFIVFFVISGT